jgi:hypothetical protein
VHKAIVSEDQFWIVQEKLGNKRVTLCQPKEEFPLRGAAIRQPPCEKLRKPFNALFRELPVFID